MRCLEQIVRHLQRWVRRYKVVLNYDDTIHRRSIPREIEWNGEMIGELRRQSADDRRGI
jgi:hypothetical protein